MKHLNIFTVIFTLLILGFSFTSATAQNETPVEKKTPTVNQIQRRPNLLQELNLSPEQVRQIRRINQSRKPLMQDAQLRLREANRALDQAIYAEVPNETEVQERLKNVQLAQAEVIKNRTQIEFAIRQVLTPEQLVKFRELRQQLIDVMENRKKMRANPRRVNNLNRQRQRGF